MLTPRIAERKSFDQVRITLAATKTQPDRNLSLMRKRVSGGFPPGTGTPFV